MMASENQVFERPQFYASRNPLESPVLHDDDCNSNKSSNSNGGANGNQHNSPLLSPVPYAEILTAEDGDPLVHASSLYQSSNSFNTFIEPPSYAEAVFRSFDGDHGNQINDHHGDVSTSAPSTNSDYLKISVTDPKEQDIAANSVVAGGNTYMTYLVTTWTNLPEFNGTEFSVRRRFKDVVMLSDWLSDSYRGFFIPTRPDKNVIESQVMQKHEFIEQRRMDLEKYLRKLAVHPVIRNSEGLRMFLQVQGKLPFMSTTNTAAKTIDHSEVGHQGKGGNDMLRTFRELRLSVTYGWGGTKPPLVEEDRDFMEKRMKLQDFETQLSNVSMQAESLVKAQQDIGETMGQLGLAFVKLTKFETEEAMFNSQKVRAGDMKNVSTSAVKASRLYRELNSQTIKHLDKFHDYLGVMLDVNNAYSDRSRALLTVQTLVSEVSTLNSRIEKLEAVASKVFGGDRSRIQKIEELKETLKVTDDAKNCAVREYEHIKKNNKNEFERLDKERHKDFLGMMKGFVANQAGYAEKMASVWETVASETSGYAQSCT